MKQSLGVGIILALGLLVFQTVPVHAHEPFNVGPYHIEVGWAAEPVVTWQQNAVTVIVTNATSGLGIPGLASNLTITLSYAGQSKVFKGPAGQILTTEVDGIYNAPVILTQPGSYNATVAGVIGHTAINLHAFPDQFERVQDGYLGGDNGIMFPSSSPSPAALQNSINDTNNRAVLMGYVGIGLGIGGIALAALVLFRRRSTSGNVKSVEDASVK